MNRLIVDTSTSHTFLQFIKRGKTNHMELTKASLERDDWFAKLVDEYFEEDLDSVAIGRGPGSFTGLRISFAYIKIRCLLQNIPLFTFSSGRFWHSFFELPENAWLCIRMNKNMYYAFNSLGDFKAVESSALSNSQLPDFFDFNEVYLWETSGRKTFPALAGGHNTSRNLHTIEKLNNPRFQFPNEILEPADSESALPDYGHEIQYATVQNKRN